MFLTSHKQSFLHFFVYIIMKTLKSIFSISSLLLAFLLSASCARQGYPNGGPVDKEPPMAKSMSPSNESLHFTGNRFSIDFDEYIQLKDADNNVIVSPPMNPKPEYKANGRRLEVTLRDTLQPNMTYLFQFKGAVVDFHEGNPLPSLEYAFSTGDAIDSMELRGTVVDALTGKPAEETLSILAYPADAQDSVVALQNPIYMTRSDKQGRFLFSHIRKGDFRIVALDDANKNMRFNPGEAIAWTDNPVVSNVAHRKDSTSADSANTFNDAIAKKAPSPQCQLFLSKNEKTVQRFTQSEFTAASRIQLVSVVPLIDPQISSADNLVWKLNANHDTINIWMLNKDVDSTLLYIQDASGINDTLKLKYRPKRNKSQRGNTFAQEKTEPVANFTFGQNSNFYDTLNIHFSSPIPQDGRQSNDSIVQILKLKDSTTTYAGLVWDSLGLNAQIQFTPKAGNKYQFFVKDKQFTNIYGATSDSLKVTTEVNTPESFGNILFHIESTQMPLVIQLLDEKDNMLRTSAIKEPGDVKFSNLKPGKYRIRTIFDSNGNGTWDPGDYWQHLQPERVIYYTKTLELRANWDMEETWKVISDL